MKLSNFRVESNLLSTNHLKNGLFIYKMVHHYLDKRHFTSYNKLVKAMTRTSSKEQTPTESRRLVRGAGSTFYEYISKLRTEM